MSKSEYYDIFISHAFEDKIPFVNELASALNNTGLKIWYSGNELNIGDSIAESINRALCTARLGIVVISPVYLEKKWTLNEFNILLAQESKENRILPILHNISVDEIKTRFPILADRYSISSSKGIDFIVKRIMDAVAKKNIRANNQPSGSSGIKNKKRNEPDINNEKQNPMSSPKIKNTNTNTNTVNVDSGNGKTILLIILIIAAIGLYLAYENSNSDSPAANKENSKSSISN